MKKSENKSNNAPLYKKWWFWIVAVVVIIALMAIAGSGMKNENGPTTDETKTTQETQSKEDALEKKLGVVESITACEQYGRRNYPDFDVNVILGKIAEQAVDDNTWFIKYKVDIDKQKDLTMECYVTGTTDNPQVKDFIVY